MGGATGGGCGTTTGGGATGAFTGTVTITGAATHLSARQLINLGVINWNNGNLLLSNGTIDNRGTFNANNSSTSTVREIQALIEPSYFYNSGTIVKTGLGTIRVLPNVTFSSSGVIDVQQGAFEYGLS